MVQHLLAIEDDQKIASLICKVANEVGFISHTANGTTAIAMYNEFRPEIIVLDIFMPDMDGLEVLRFLQQSNSTARIVILSGQQNYSKIAETLGSAASLMIEANLRKPFRIAEIRQLLETLKNAPAVHKKVTPKTATV
jgi:DNA-binding response OmpR family regulator